MEKTDECQVAWGRGCGLRVSFLSPYSNPLSHHSGPVGALGRAPRRESALPLPSPGPACAGPASLPRPRAPAQGSAATPRLQLSHTLQSLNMSTDRCCWFVRCFCVGGAFGVPFPPFFSAVIMALSHDWHTHSRERKGRVSRSHTAIPRPDERVGRVGAGAFAN